MKQAKLEGEGRGKGPSSGYKGDGFIGSPVDEVCNRQLQPSFKDRIQLENLHINQNSGGKESSLKTKEKVWHFLEPPLPCMNYGRA